MVNVYPSELTRKDTLTGGYGPNQGASPVPPNRPKLNTKQNSFIGSILGPAFDLRRSSITSDQSGDKNQE